MNVKRRAFFWVHLWLFLLLIVSSAAADDILITDTSSFEKFISSMSQPHGLMNVKLGNDISLGGKADWDEFGWNMLSVQRNF